MNQHAYELMDEIPDEIDEMTTFFFKRPPSQLQNVWNTLQTYLVRSRQLLRGPAWDPYYDKAVDIQGVINLLLDEYKAARAWPRAHGRRVSAFNEAIAQNRNLSRLPFDLIEHIISFGFNKNYENYNIDKPMIDLVQEGWLVPEI